MKNKILITVSAMVFMCFGCNTKSTDPNRPMEAPSGYMNETFLKISYGLGMLDLIDAKPKVIPEGIQEIKNIEYKNINGKSLQLDVYKRKDLQTPAPTLIFVHGGSWRSGKRSDYLFYLLDYAQKGYVTVTVSYRMIKDALFPAAVQDLDCAVRWIRQHADEYGIDADRMALVGGSAGAHLSLLVGYDGDNPAFIGECGPDSISSSVKAIVNLYGPIDLTTDYAIGTYQVQDFLGKLYEDDPELYQLASPRFHISAGDPPTLTFHGTIDSLVPVSQADSLDAWLANVHVPHEYHRLKGWPHTMDLSVKVNEYCRFYMDDFFEKYL